MQDNIRLREMGPRDGPALERLNRETPDTGRVAFFTQFLHDPYEVLRALHPSMVGVVAEAGDHDGLVGMGLAHFGECLYEGELLPYAYFNSLSVHPEYRRRGIAARLGSWRVEVARRQFEQAGKEGIIFAGIQGGNTGSLHTAVKWSNGRIDGRSQVGVVRMRTSPPKPVDGLLVRPAMDGELGEIEEKESSFYHQYNLYPPQTADQLKEWRSARVLGHPVHEYMVAVDSAGNIEAGMALTARGELTTDHVVRLPGLIRVANVFLRVIPPGGVTRRISAERIWCAPGKTEAGRFLWESARWLWRERGTNMMTFFDPRSPLAQMVTLPRFAPKSLGSIVLHTPMPVQEARLVYFSP
ncbi:MAG: GNAT family N-acetyltransferase [Chloroflexia bacterium]